VSTAIDLLLELGGDPFLLAVMVTLLVVAGGAVAWAVAQHAIEAHAPEHDYPDAGDTHAALPPLPQAPMRTASARQVQREADALLRRAQTRAAACGRPPRLADLLKRTPLPPSYRGDAR
jgi:hypothetical protein